MNTNISNDLLASLAQAVDEMKAENAGKINLAELERRTGISRQRLRTLQKNDFKVEAAKQETRKVSLLMVGFESISNELLKSGITNSKVHLSRLKEFGFTGSLSTVKRYISAHRNLVPAKRQLVEPKGPRGRRYQTLPGEAYQMDWGFIKMQCFDGTTYTVACFAMICHHCGKKYIEFFPNARQENLFIGMLHGFLFMGVPRYILTDNMKSVVVGRDLEGKPIWQKDYESFMKTVGFATKLCKPRHPFTKGKVERLIRFVKNNFLAGRTFWNISDLNEAALAWCNEVDQCYKKEIDDIPNFLHNEKCFRTARALGDNKELLFYLCPERKISFDGFVNYEGRRFGVPFRFKGKTVRVCRDLDVLKIYTPDLKELLTTHEVTWSKRDRFCNDQYSVQPEEHPTAPIKTQIKMLPPRQISLGFDKFDFCKEESND